MAEIATFLLEHLGLPALIIVFGFVADYISTPALKQLAIEKLQSGKRSRTAPFAKKLLSSFLTEFLYRIFDKGPSWRFLARSAAVSLVLLILFFAIQLFYYDEAADHIYQLAERPSLWIAIAVIAIIVNVAIDFLSNLATVVLLRLASLSGRLSDTAIVILADLSLTIILFTLLFPIAIVAATMLVERATVSVNAEAKQVPTNFLTMISDVIPRVGTDKDLKLSVIAVSRPDEGVYRTLFYLWRRENKMPREVLQDFAELSSNFGKTKVAIIKDATDEKVELLLSVPRDPEPLNLIRFAYYKAFALGNVIRDEFLGAVRLYPIVADYRTIYATAIEERKAANERKEAKVPLAIKCQDGEKKTIEVDTLQSAELPCPVETMVLLLSALDADRSFKQAAFPPGGIPVSPFFLTSFASSVIYYFALLLLVFGAFVVRMMRRIVDMPYVETTAKPFTILSLALFIPAVAIWMVLRVMF